MSNEPRVKVLMVCMGNICRSPLAHGLFQHLVKEAGLTDLVEIDSAGTHAYHVGEPPDPRSRETALRRGIDLSEQRARKVSQRDFDYYDYILAMDLDNLAILQSACPTEHREKIRLFLDFAKDVAESEVPDPYYGGESGFESVYDLVDAAANGLLKEIRSRHLLS
jgi:protein-tyrosine phosphatase